MRLLNREEVDINNIQWLPTEPAISKFKIRGKYLVYDENSMLLWEVSKEIYDRVDLKKIGTRKKPYFPLAHTQSKWKMLVFQSTYACNLDCGYCMVTQHYTNHSNRLDLKVALDALHLYQPVDAGKDYNIGFFGGEPLLNWSLIYNLMEEVKTLAIKNNRQASFHITTNATLITEEMAKYFAQNNVTFIVSLDGEEQFHNNNRPYHQGSGTWKDVMKGLYTLANAFRTYSKRKRPPITLRGTFDSSGVDLVTSLAFLNKLMYEGQADHVSIEPSSLGESCSTSSVTFENQLVEEIRAVHESEYYMAADWFLDELKAGRKPSFHHFEMPIQRVYDRIPAVSECGAGKGYLSIGPGGSIAACHREHGSYLGDMYNGGIDPSLQAKWFDNRLYNRTTCPDCWRRNLCGGGCRCNSVLIKGNLYEPSVVECLFKEMQTLPAFWLMSEMTEDQIQLYSRTRKPSSGENNTPQGLPQANKNFHIELQDVGDIPYQPHQQVQQWHMQRAIDNDLKLNDKIEPSKNNKFSPPSVKPKSNLQRALLEGDPAKVLDAISKVHQEEAKEFGKKEFISSRSLPEIDSSTALKQKKQESWMKSDNSNKDNFNTRHEPSEEKREVEI